MGFELVAVAVEVEIRVLNGTPLTDLGKREGLLAPLVCSAV